MKSETSVLVQHALVGLLKNLSIPAKNKDLLGEANIIAKLAQMGVWQSRSDALGSVQGAGVGIVKNLCKGNRTL